MPNRYFTASIPYVNADPHVGYALELVQTDVLVRYYRGQGDVVRGQFGSDDNSLKVVRAAEAAGEPVEAYAARHAQHFLELKEALNLEFGAGEEFMRTRADQHIRGAQKLWQALNPEDLYERHYEGLYCVGCEAFYDATDLNEGNICKTHNKPVEVVAETNWFFRLSKYQAQLQDLLERDVIKVHPASRKNELLAFVRRGLQDFSLSRSAERAAHWGVPVPGDEGQVMYVWVDALSNYITALGYADEARAFQQFWLEGATRTHVIGKDIVRFHAVYWPAFLLSAGLPLPTEIFVHGFLTLNGQKISKSLGNVIAPADLIATYGPDGTRAILLAALPADNDGDLSPDFFEATYTRLANGIGNLAGRIAAMSNKYFEGSVDRLAYPGEEKFKADLAAAIEARDFKEYLELCFRLAEEGNAKIENEAPFRTAKTDLPAARQTLSELAALMRVLAAALTPLIPAAGAELSARFAGDTLIHGQPIFPRSE
jgi:methionyl-tRNA synthetase